MKKLISLALMCSILSLASCVSETSENINNSAQTNEDNNKSADPEKETYLVTFKDGDATLYSKDFARGSTPSFSGKAPTKDLTEKDGVTTIFTFVGWSENPNADASEAISGENLPAVTKDTIYFAIYSKTESTKNKYSVSFKIRHSANNDEELSSGYVFEDDFPTYALGDPQKQETWNGAQKTTYTFVGWNENPSASTSQAIATKNLPAVKKDTVYFAIFSSTTVTVTYQITFMNGDTPLGNPKTVNHGTQPKYDGTLPTKDPTQSAEGVVTYTFAGWNEDPDAEASNAINNDNLPAASKDTTYYAIFSSSIDYIFTLSDETVELDCGSTRTSWKHDSSLKNGTSAVLPQNIEISANIPSSLSGKVKVDWSIPTADSNYFSLNSSTGNQVTVSANNPSRLSTLTATLKKTSDNSVIKTATCELRSVLINTYWTGNQAKTDNKICGVDIGDYATGYTARFYNTSYTDNLDIVFPSKLKEGNSTQNVCRIVGLAKSDGSGGAGGEGVPCRNVFIPNTVYMVSGSSFMYLKPTGKVIFQSGGVKYTYFDTFALHRDAANDIYGLFLNKINLTDGTFPYKKYKAVSGEDDSVIDNNGALSLSDLTSLQTIRDINGKTDGSAKTKLFLSKE